MDLHTIPDVPAIAVAVHRPRSTITWRDAGNCAKVLVHVFRTQPLDPGT